MYNILASQISDKIDIDSVMETFKAELLYSDHVESFYEVDTELYVSIFRYGVVCFFNYDEDRINEFTEYISKHCKYFYDCELNKVYKVDSDADELQFGINKAKITYFDIDTLRLIMLNVAQSVGLNYYFQQGRILLEETSKHTSILEVSGKLDISDKELKKFIGKTHSLKNHIVENLHIIDSVTETHQNDYLIKIDKELKSAFFMEKRVDNIYKELEIIREHLDYFSNIVNYGASMKLEWIIIILLLIFVIDIIFSHVSF